MPLYGWSPDRIGVLPGRWAEESLCSQADPDEWFPDKGGCGTKAKEICKACPVVELCLQFALDTHQAEGIWGGMSPNERKKLRRVAA